MTNEELLDCLTDRLCSVCKFHKENGCSKWDCVFEQREQEPKTEWIPVSNRLPETNGEYLVTSSSFQKGFVDSLDFVNGKWFFDDGEHFADFTNDVIAWMPLPKPYTEG